MTVIVVRLRYKIYSVGLVGGGERISSFCKYYQRKNRKTAQDQFPFYSFWMGFIIGREKKSAKDRKR
jgi:hypothetical protein